ncbi:universal stress protein [Nocardioides coralli]|uniref:universal stress protein n=1 Tax=Nocardioides coralli TaxID=2872154 RepID=UPI001CA3DEBA|nr:universal stress protein [Nocardioides coralli]QZY29221.1 universal stress protein [Nocardioides coralli]
MSDVVSQVDLDGGVLVGHDGSATAARAVQWAATHAAAVHVPLHVLRAWSLTTAPTPPTQELGYVPPLADYEAAVRDELAADVAALDLDCEVHLHVVHAATAQALLDAAEGADLLVVGRRGRGGFRGLVFGSTADQAVRHAPCPVTTVPVHPEDE